MSRCFDDIHRAWEATWINGPEEDWEEEDLEDDDLEDDDLEGANLEKANMEGVRK